MQKNDIRLGISSIGWMNDDCPDLGKNNTFESCIDDMAKAGFTGSEIGSRYPKDPYVLKEALAEKGLQICGCWFETYITSKPLSDTVARFTEQCDKLVILGAKTLCISEQGNSIQAKRDTPILGADKPVYTREQWQAITDGFNLLGQIAVDKGLFMTVHPHMGTGVQTGAEIDRLMESTDESKVFLLLDTGHLVYAGEDPVSVLKKYVKRTRHVHLKDIRKNVLARVAPEGMSFIDAVRAGVFTVPGDGDILFDDVFRLLIESGYQGWFVVEAEQDPDRANPLEYAIKARDFIRNSIRI